MSTLSWESVLSDVEAGASGSGGGAEGEAPKGVSLGLEYRVCADRGEVLSVRDASLEDGTAAAPGMKKMGSSFTPTLEKAFSSRTGEAVRARGRACVGKHGLHV